MFLLYRVVYLNNNTVINIATRGPKTGSGAKWLMMKCDTFNQMSLPPILITMGSSSSSQIVYLYITFCDNWCHGIGNHTESWFRMLLPGPWPVTLALTTYGWVHYPTLGCNIQGFQAMGLSVQYWPRWFLDFPVIWLVVPFRANGAHLGISTLPEKIFLVCEINCFWVK